MPEWVTDRVWEIEEIAGLLPQNATCASIGRKETAMPYTPAFYSINETKKLPSNRVHHNNSTCPPGRDIPQQERKLGDGGYRLCDDCRKLNDQKK
jgi:hypothetical protein